MTPKGQRRQRALQDHKQRGKVFIPPFVAGLADYPNVEGHSWLDDISPELMWIALLYLASPGQSGELARETVLSAKTAYRGADPPIFTLISSWSLLSTEESRHVREDLEEKDIFKGIAKFLDPLISLYPECPMTAVFQTRTEPISTAVAKRQLEKMLKAAEILLIRRTKPAALVQGICVYATVSSGSMAPQGLGLQRLPSLMDYPVTSESRQIEQTIRLTTGMITRCCGPNIEWRKYFWRRGQTLSNCLIAPDRFHAGTEDDTETAEKLVALFEELSAGIERDIMDAWAKMPVDLAEPRKSQVIGGLLARQARYLRHLLTTPKLLLGELGDLLVRAMAESAINLAWLIRKGQAADYERFVLYGLGQEKLVLDHLGARPEAGVYLEERRQRELAARQEWLQSERFPHLLSVDVSVSWSAPKKLRDLAEEVDMIDLYNTVYTPASALVHGTWNAIARTSLRYCFNPLHRLHMVPDVETTRIDLMTVVTGLRIMSGSWDVTRQWAADVPPTCCVHDGLARMIATLDAEASKNEPGEGGER